MSLLAQRALRDLALESYTEGPDSLFTHVGATYHLDPFLIRAESLPVENVPMSEVSWIIKYSDPEPSRIKAADIAVPSLATEHPQFGLVVFDGLHRLVKAYSKGKKTFLIKRVPAEWFEQVPPVDKK